MQANSTRKSMRRKFAHFLWIRTMPVEESAGRFFSTAKMKARARGFRRFELMATLPGVRLYREYAYVGDARVQYEMQPGLTTDFVPMSKDGRE